MTKTPTVIFIENKGIRVSIIKEKLKMQWSPKQISGWLKKCGYTKCVSHETIYKLLTGYNFIGALPLQLSLTAYSFSCLRLMMLVTSHHSRLDTGYTWVCTSLTVLSTVSICAPRGARHFYFGER